MGKIGDLWVKLGLKKQEFDKGMKDAENKAEGFGAKMQKIKGIGLAVWAAIGGAVVAMGKSIISATNEMEDAWAMFTTKARAGWNTFIRTLTNGDWSNFITNFKAEVASAARLQEVLDADTEIMNSINIQKARMAEQLARLEISMRDQTKSYKERAAAAQEYMRLVDPIYQKEIERVEKLKKAHMDAFVGRSSFVLGSVEDPENLRRMEELIVAYGDLTKIPELRNATFAEAIGGQFLAAETFGGATKEKVNAANQKLIEYLRKRFDFSRRDFTDSEVMQYVRTFFDNYERNRNGEDVQALVEAIIGLEKAEAARDSETRKVQSALNAAIKGMESDSPDSILQEFINDLTWLDDIADDPIELPEIDVTPLESAEEALDDFVAKWQEEQQKIAELNDMLEDSIMSSMSNGLQALTDMMMGLEDADMKSVLSAFLMPFADTLKQMGSMIMAEGIAMKAFKDSFKNPSAAIAAGAALIAIGSIVSSGLQALAANPAGSGGSVATTGASSANTETYKSELTVYVEGRISGSDIVLAGNKTLSKWRR